MNSIKDVREGRPVIDLARAEEMARTRDERLAAMEEDQEDLAQKLEDKQELVFLGNATEEGRVRAGIELAHQLFLYGLPEGPRKNVPIRKLSRLRTLTGTPVEVLERHAGTWRREAMRLAREASPLHTFACSEEAKKKHVSDLECMREEISRMEGALEELEPGSVKYEKAMKLLTNMRKEWRDASGVTSGVMVTEAALKMEAQMLVDAMREDETPEDPKHIVDGEVFDI